VATTQPGSTRVSGGAVLLPSDPLGSASRLRLARLDADVLPERAMQVLVDALTLALLVAAPVLAVLVAAVLVAVPPVVPLVAAGLAVAVVVVGSLVVWPHHDGGRTAGMRWAGLRVADRDGAVPTRGAMAVRALLLPVDALVGVPMVLVRADRRRLGDLLAGTQVVRDLSAGAGPAGRRGAATTPRPRSRRASTRPR
jgi:uncharacterized RDD family membrane protein YckC